MFADALCAEGCGRGGGVLGLTERENTRDLKEVVISNSVKNTPPGSPINTNTGTRLLIFQNEVQPRCSVMWLTS